MKMAVKSSNEAKVHVLAPSWKDEAPHDNRFTADLIRSQIARIVESPMFAQSARLNRFLSFVVETCLAGQEQNLKEYLIGVEVYDRKPPYHPSIDSIVRTEARRLRTKLKEYYETEGTADPIYIYFRTGSYIPVFSSRALLNVDSAPNAGTRVEASRRPANVHVTVIPFEVLSQLPLVRECAHFITDTLNHHLLMDAAEDDAKSTFILSTHEQTRYNPGNNREFLLQGSVCRSEQCFRVAVRLMDSQGAYIWSHHFDLITEDAQLFALSRQIASTVVSRLRLNSLRPHATMAGGGVSAIEYSGMLAAESMIDQNELIDWSNILERNRTASLLSSSHSRVITGMAERFSEGAFSGICSSYAYAAVAKSLFLRAIEFNPECTVSHSGIAFLFAADSKLDDAECHFRAAFASGAGACTHRLYGLFQAACGRFDDAWHHLEKAQLIDPFSRRQKIARSRVLYLSKRFDQLISELERGEIYGGNPPESQIYAALAHLEVGHIAEARELAHQVRRESVALPHLTASAAEILALCGDIPCAMRLAEVHDLLSPGKTISHLRRSLLLSALGKTAAASEALAQALECSEPETLWVMADPRFDSFYETALLRDTTPVITPSSAIRAELKLA